MIGEKLPFDKVLAIIYFMYYNACLQYILNKKIVKNYTEREKYEKYILHTW